MAQVCGSRSVVPLRISLRRLRTIMLLDVAALEENILKVKYRARYRHRHRPRLGRAGPTWDVASSP